MITEEELEFLWNRDKAWKLDRPSIDRKDNNGHYTIENCEFIELKKNTGKDLRKPILQYSKDNKFIKEFGSVTQASMELSINLGHIASCARGKLKTSGGFKWKYKENMK